MKAQLNMCLTYQATERPHVSIIHGDKLNKGAVAYITVLRYFRCSGQFEVGLYIERAVLGCFIETM